MVSGRSECLDGADIEINESGWSGCTEDELSRRRNEFLRTAARLLWEQRSDERTAERQGKAGTA